MNPGKALVGDCGGKKVMKAGNGFDQILRRLSATQRSYLRAGDENPGHVFRRHARFPGSVDCGLHRGMKRVSAGNEFDRHVRDDVPLFAEVAREFLGVELSAAEDSEKTPRRF